MWVKLTHPQSVLVTGLLLVVVSLIGPLVWWMVLHRHLAMVHRDMESLVQAGRRFHEEYGIWPSQYVRESGDLRYGRELSNAEVLHVLRAIAGPGNEGDAVNPNHIVFFEPPPAVAGRSGLNEQGEYVDPWGNPYQMVMDNDLNSVCDISDSMHGMGIEQGIVVWSCGPDGASDTGDDILSWK